MQIEVGILPQATTRLSSRVILVIDVIRATTSLLTLFERGAHSVTLAPDIESARAEGRRRPASLLIGEIGGLAPPGFAYGNSPVELAQAQLAGHSLVFTTSNGTRALRSSAGARSVFAACMRNGRAAALLAYRAARKLDADIGIVCAGRAHCTLVGQDDIICAGYLVQCLIEANNGRIAPWQPDPDFADVLTAPPLDGGLDLDDSAMLALRVYRSIVQAPDRPRPDEIAHAFRQTAVGVGLERLGLDHDTSYCAEIDRTELVPILDTALSASDRLIMTSAVEPE